MDRKPATRRFQTVTDCGKPFLKIVPIKCGGHCRNEEPLKARDEYLIRPFGRLRPRPAPHLSFHKSAQDLSNTNILVRRPLFQGGVHCRGDLKADHLLLHSRKFEQPWLMLG